MTDYKNYSDFLQMHVDLVHESPSGKCTKSALELARTSIQIRELSMDMRSRMQRTRKLGYLFRRDISEFKGDCDDQ